VKKNHIWKGANKPTTFAFLRNQIVFYLHDTVVRKKNYYIVLKSVICMFASAEVKEKKKMTCGSVLASSGDDVGALFVFSPSGPHASQQFLRSQ